MNINKNILITGNRNAGKTFLVKRMIDRFGYIKIAGFFTKKEENGTVTFRVWDNFYLHNNEPEIVIFDPISMAIKKNIFDEIGVWILKYALNNADLIVCDELGRFEVGCKKFTETVFDVLDSDRIVIAVIKNENNPFLDRIRSRNDIVLYKIDEINRDEMQSKISNLLKSLVKGLFNQ